jgi:hypothetical protein
MSCLKSNTKTFSTELWRSSRDRIESSASHILLIGCAQNEQKYRWRSVSQASVPHDIHERCVRTATILGSSGMSDVATGVQAVAFLAEVLCYKPRYGPVVDSAPNGNEYSVSFGGEGRSVRKADNLCAISEPLTPHNPVGLHCLLQR